MAKTKSDVIIAGAAGDETKPSRRRRSASPDAKAAREQEIIDAAYRAFLAKGYEATSMAEIARGANIQGGTIYLYFSSKRELLLKIISRLYNRYVEDLLRGIADMANFRDRMRFLVRRDLRVYIEEPMLWRLIHEEVRVKPEYSGSSFEADSDRLYKLIGDIIAQGVSEGALRTDISVEAIRDFCVAVLLGAGFRIIYGSVEIDIEAEVDIITELILNGASSPVTDVAGPHNDRLDAAIAKLERLVERLPN